MDYSKLSDLEINLRVAEIIYPGKEFTSAYSFGEPEGPMVQWVQGYAEYLKLDYCNNAADAWPIILENEISINYCQAEGEWLAHADGLMKKGCWCWDVEPSPFFLDINPLRAAMIVYLMMQDGD